MGGRSSSLASPDGSVVDKSALTSASTSSQKMSAPTHLDKEQILLRAEKDLEYKIDLFNRLTQTCFGKRVDKRYKETELNIGENSCIDCCVSKYLQVANIIGQLLASNIDA